MKSSFLKFIFLAVIASFTLACELLFPSGSKSANQNPLLPYEIQPTSVSRSTSASPVTTAAAPAAANPPSPYGCDNPGLTAEERANCGIHAYTYTAKAICPEGNISNPTGSEQDTFIFDGNKLILNLDMIKDAEKKSENTYQGIAHNKKGTAWEYLYVFEMGGYSQKTKLAEDDHFCFVYQYTLADK